MFCGSFYQLIFHWGHPTISFNINVSWKFRWISFIKFEKNKNVKFEYPFKIIFNIIDQILNVNYYICI